MQNNDQFLRQSNAFPVRRRSGTRLAVVGGQANPVATRAAIMAASLMGAPRVGSDINDGGELGSHWFQGRFDELLRHISINGDSRFHYLDGHVFAKDMQALLSGSGNGWGVFFLNDLRHAHDAIQKLVDSDVGMRVLLALSAPAGIVVQRCPSPAAALTQISSLHHSIGSDHIPPGTTELSYLAAAACITDVMQGWDPSYGDEATMIAYYCLHERNRVASVAAPGLADLVQQISCPLERASFSNLSLIMVGAGATGNCVSLILSDESPRLEIHDGDPEVESHNLNRQPLLARSVGQDRPKVNVLVEELAGLDPRGSYQAVAKHVTSTADLHLEHCDALFCCPDNDAARRVCGDAAREAATLLGTCGSSASGAESIVSEPARACLRCVMGTPRSPGAESADTGHSCRLAEDDAVIGSSIVASALVVSEIREALSGRRTANLRFNGEGSCSVNRFARMIGDPPCPHRSNPDSSARAGA